MKKINSFALTLVFGVLLAVSFQLTSFAYTIKSQYASTETCDYKIGGSFIVWWDKNFDNSAQATDALKYLQEVQSDCINKFKMEQPLTVKDGYYINVYLHNKGSVFDEYNFRNYMSIEKGKHQFLAIPSYMNTPINYYHEGFHLFQSSSSNFGTGGNMQWFSEALANWYRTFKSPNEVDNYIIAPIYANPQLPIWYSDFTKESEDPENWQRGNHRYAMGPFLHYLTKNGVISNYNMAHGFYAIKDTPMIYLYNKIGATKFSNMFISWAAHLRAGADGFPEGTVERSQESFDKSVDKTDIHEYIKVYKNSGTNANWVRPNEDDVTRSWGFNVFKINNTLNSKYTFTLDGDLNGSDGTESIFKAKIAIKSKRGVSYNDLKMTNKQDGSATIDVKSTDSEIYLIIASTPNKFEGNEKFSYKVKIEKK